MTKHTPLLPSAERRERIRAAAPELLRALKGIMECLPTRRDWLDPVVEADARDAIAKAEAIR